MALPEIVREQEYLAAERGALEEHEFVQRQALAMSDASGARVRITTRRPPMAGYPGVGGACKPDRNDLRVSTPRSGGHFYPDLSVVYGEPEVRDDGELDSVQNPKVIFPALSPSTEAYDRGQKFRDYSSVPRLENDVPIASTSSWVEVFDRLPNGAWRWPGDRGPENVASVATLDLAFSLSELHVGIHLEPPASTE